MNATRSFIVWIVLLGMFLGVYLLLEYLGFSTSRVLSFVLFLMPIWLPVVTFFIFYETWMGFVRYHFTRKAPRTTLEIILPQEIYKSPVAMELVINQLFQTAGIDNHVQSYWDGKHPPTFALELVSTHGQVRFCINCQKKFRNMIEAQLYAQYPGIMVRELDIDYTAEIPENAEGYSSFAFHFKLAKPDPYPIRTYFDYGLQANPKEEEKVDPLTVTLETLGSLGPNEHMWIQILIKANKGYDFKSGSLTKTADWKQDVKAEINNIIENAKKRNGEAGGPPQLTEGERDNIKALERSLSKYAFNTYIRTIYLAKGDAFDGSKIGTMATSLRPSDDVARNQIRICWRTETDWPWWQDRGGRKTAAWKRQEIEDYKRRVYTERTKSDGGMILTTEELATLFHLPGSVVLNPNVQRIGSARSEAPSNLPI